MRLVGSFSLPLLLLLLSAGGTGGVVVEIPLPYGGLRHLPPPKGYVAYTCPPGTPMATCWALAPHTEEFVDIVGPSIRPWYRTTAKMLWDADNLYIAAEMEEPRAFAHQTLHDRCLQHGTARAHGTTPA